MDVTVTDSRGELIAMLSRDLIARQGIGDDEISALKQSHRQRADLFDRMRTAPEAELLNLAGEFDQLEFHQQGLWRFERDAKHHFWFQVPRCACCEATNTRLYGVSHFRAVNPNCPVHGQLLCADGGDGPEVVVVQPESYIGTAWLWVPTTANHVARPPGHRFVDTSEGVQGRALLEFRRPSELASH